MIQLPVLDVQWNYLARVRSALDSGRVMPPFNLSPSLIRISGGPQLPRIRQCVAALVRRHPALRTVIQISDAAMTREATRQVVRPAVTSAGIGVVLPYHGMAAVQRDLQTSAAIPFDLLADVRIRCNIYPDSPTSAILSVVADHLFVDEWAMQLLLDDLHSMLNGDTNVAARSDEDYAAYVRSEDDRLYDPNAVDPVHWSRTLCSSGHPEIRLPGVGTSTLPYDKFHTARWVIEPETADVIRGTAQTLRITPFCLFATCLHVAAYVLSGESQPVVRLSANRTVDNADLVCNAAHETAERLPMSGTDSIEGLVVRLWRQLHSESRHTDIPLPTVLRVLGPNQVTTDRKFPWLLLNMSTASAARNDKAFGFQEITVSDANRHPLTIAATIHQIETENWGLSIGLGSTVGDWETAERLLSTWRAIVRTLSRPETTLEMLMATVGPDNRLPSGGVQ